MKETQKFLNYFVNANLVIDGIQGGKTNAAINEAVIKIRQKFEKEGLVWDSKFNFIGIRTNNEFTDMFTDWFVCFAYDTIFAVPSTTKSGKLGVVEGQNNWHKGINGVLVIAPNQQIDYLLVNPNDPTETFPNKHWSGRCFLYQDKNFYYYRDNNNDSKVDYGKKHYGGAYEIGGNVHTWTGFNFGLIYNLSKGCQVCQEMYFDPIEDLWIKFNKDKRITYTILEW